MFLSIPGICRRRKTGSPYGTSLPPYANSNRTELVRKLLLEFERLVQRFLKFLLRLAISGPIALLHSRVGPLLIVPELLPVLPELLSLPESVPDDESVPSVPEEPSVEASPLVSDVSVLPLVEPSTFSASPADAPELPPNT